MGNLPLKHGAITVLHFIRYGVSSGEQQFSPAVGRRIWLLIMKLNLNISNVMQLTFLLFGLLHHYSGSEHMFLYKSMLAGLYFNW